MNTVSNNFDVIVVGAGLAGISASISSARKGLKVCLIGDRPVLGGNASSEVRMWVRGASDHFPLYREGGVLEEIALDNIFYNPDMNYHLWDGVLYNKVINESNITLMLNTVCTGANTENDKIVSINAFGLTTYDNYTLYADYFIDCSGDSILAETSNAQFVTGRESKEEFNESLGLETSDNFTMGNSVLLQAVEKTHKVKFTPPPFARKITDETEFRHRLNLSNPLGFIGNNYWWIELGGTQNSLKDAEKIRAELLATVYGVWDFVKNSGKYNADNWDLNFIGFYPAKRETRRYVGDYILTQNDIDNHTTFNDEIAYGGWTMDNHDPRGFYQGVKPNVFNTVTAPYQIPYRSLYSKNIKNLAFAGRNISVTHLALSSTRVMATCSLLGLAVGNATFIAKKYGVDYRGVNKKIDELKQEIINSDGYLLNTKRQLSNAILTSKNDLDESQKQILFSGNERALTETESGAKFTLNKPVTFEFEEVFADKIRLLFDNDIGRVNHQVSKDLKMFPQICHYPIEYERPCLSGRLTKGYKLEVKENGKFVTLKEVNDNHQRLNILAVNKKISGIRYTPLTTYGEEYSYLFSIDLI